MGVLNELLGAVGWIFLFFFGSLFAFALDVDRDHCSHFFPCCFYVIGWRG